MAKNKSTYAHVAGSVFGVIALIHFLRILNVWKVTVAGWVVPMEVSWVAVLIAGWLAWTGLHKK